MRAADPGIHRRQFAKGIMGASILGAVLGHEAVAATSTAAIVHVDRISELRGFGSSQSTEVYFLLWGYYSRGDKPPRLYHFDSQSTAADNNGTVIASTTGRVGRYVGLFNDVTVRDFGAVGDGASNDTSAINNAIASNPGELHLPAGNYRINGTVTLANPIVIHGEGAGNTVITAIHGPNDPYLFRVLANDVQIRHLRLNGPTSPTYSSVNKYAIFVGDGQTKFRNVKLRDLKITNMNFRASGSITNLIVNHCIYIDNVDQVVIEDVHIESATGSGIFLRDVEQVDIRRNRIVDAVWYPIHLEGGVTHFTIADNQIISNIASGVFFGGGIDLMSQHSPMHARNRVGVIRGNRLTGKYSYGAVIRIQSSEEVVIEANVLEDLSTGSAGAAPGDLGGIRIDTRGVAEGSPHNGPSRNIRVCNNTLVAPTGSSTNRAIYIGNLFQTQHNPATDFYIQGNLIHSPSATQAWESGIIVHGGNGGVENVRVTGNKVVVATFAVPVVPGAIGFQGMNAGGAVRIVFVGDNHIVGLHDADQTYQIGLGIGENVDEVFNTGTNRIQRFYFGVRTFTASGPRLVALDDQHITDSHQAFLLFDDELGLVSHKSLAGLSSQRPAMTIGLPGYAMYFDTTLRKPVWFDGTDWVDATGANV